MKKLKAVLLSYLITGSFAGACYDAHAPNLPACDEKTSTWPDPCTAHKTMDAGQDARITDATTTEGAER